MKAAHRVSRTVFMILAWGLALCILVQTLIAGLAIFTHASYWASHRIFVHIFGYLPILMLVFAFACRLPHSLRWHCVGLYALIYVQYFTANFPNAGALHPVIALLLFWHSLVVAQHAAKNLRHEGT